MFGQTMRASWMTSFDNVKINYRRRRQSQRWCVLIDGRRMKESSLTLVRIEMRSCASRGRLPATSLPPCFLLVGGVLLIVCRNKCTAKRRKEEINEEFICPHCSSVSCFSLVVRIVSPDFCLSQESTHVPVFNGNQIDKSHFLCSNPSDTTLKSSFGIRSTKSNSRSRRPWSRCRSSSICLPSTICRQASLRSRFKLS